MRIPLPASRPWLSFLLMLLLSAGCIRCHRPVVETVRTANSPTPIAAAHDLADVMATNLQLSPEQTTKVRAVLNGTVAQANAAKTRYPPQSPQLLAELKRINKTAQNELCLVLGPSKFRQLQANQRQMAAEMQQRQK